MLSPKTYKNQLIFSNSFGKSMNIVALSFKITQNRQKPLYCRVFYSNAAQIVVLSCKIDENRCKPLNCRIFHRESKEIAILSFTLVAASRY